MKSEIFQERYLLSKRLNEILSFAKNDKALVIINVGAIEQHGPHLPVGMDSMVGRQWIKEIFKYIDSQIPLYIGPYITIGNSVEHLGFPGTLSISNITLRRRLLTIAMQVRDWGFKNLLILSSHGGNTSTIQYTMPEIEESLGVSAHFVRWDYYTPPVSEKELAVGIHAGEIETSLMYAFAKEHCSPDKANCEWIDEVCTLDKLGLDWGTANFAWKTSDLSKSGTMGDATRATEEKGREWLEKYARAIVREIERIYSEVV